MTPAPGGQHFQTSPLKLLSQLNSKKHMDGGTKVCINGPGHETKIDATPIYGKNPLKSEPEGLGM